MSFFGIKTSHFKSRENSNSNNNNNNKTNAYAELTLIRLGLTLSFFVTCSAGNYADLLKIFDKLSLDIQIDRLCSCGSLVIEIKIVKLLESQKIEFFNFPGTERVKQNKKKSKRVKQNEKKSKTIQNHLSLESQSLFN